MLDITPPGKTINNIGIVNDFLSEDHCRHQVRAALVEFRGSMLFTLMHWMSRSVWGSSSSSLHYLFFDGDGVNGVYQLLQQLKDPSVYEPAPKQEIPRETGFIKRIVLKVKGAMKMTGIIREFGVISDLNDAKIKVSCKVKGLLRKPEDEYILTFEYTTKDHGNNGGAWIDFDAKGIKKLERAIERLKEQKVYPSSAA